MSVQFVEVILLLDEISQILHTVGLAHCQLAV